MITPPLYEELRAPPTPEGSEGLLAIIIRNGYIPAVPGATFFTPPTSSQQLGALKHEKGKIIAPHQHRAIKREIHATQEVLIVRVGVMTLFLYTSDGTLVSSRTLYAGDIVLLVAGGHGLRMEEDTILIEVKQGPYAGTMDKTPLPSKSGTNG